MPYERPILPSGRRSSAAYSESARMGAAFVADRFVSSLFHWPGGSGPTGLVEIRSNLFLGTFGVLRLLLAARSSGTRHCWMPFPTSFADTVLLIDEAQFGQALAGPCPILSETYDFAPFDFDSFRLCCVWSRSCWRKVGVGLSLSKDPYHLDEGSPSATMVSLSFRQVGRVGFSV